VKYVYEQNWIGEAMFTAFVWQCYALCISFAFGRI